MSLYIQIPYLLCYIISLVNRGLNRFHSYIRVGFKIVSENILTGRLSLSVPLSNLEFYRFL